MAELPGTEDVHRDKLLTDVSIGYKNLYYLAPKIFPIVVVTERSGIIPKFSKSDWFRDTAKELAPREPAPVGGYEVETDETYYCREYGQGHYVGDQRKANTDAPFDAYVNGTEWVTDRLLMKEERLFVTNFWKPGVWGVDRAGTTNFTKWSAYATSTPIVDIRGFTRIVRRNLGGIPPNLFALGDLTFDVLADHPNILDRIKYGADSKAPAMVTPGLLAQLFGLARVEIGFSMFTDDPKGTPEANVTYTSNYDDDALLAYVNPRPTLFSPTSGMCFAWQTFFGGPRYMKRRRDTVSDKGDLIEGFQFMHPCMTAADAGLFASDAVD